MKLHLDFPVGLGQEFRFKTMDNFRKISDFYYNIQNRINEHGTTEEHAHNAKQIDYKDTSVHNQLQYQDGRITNLIIGHNGNGIEEIKDSRVALDGSSHDLLSQRINYDIEQVKNKIEENYNKLDTKIKRIVNVNDFGADPTGQSDSTQAFIDAMRGGNKHVHMTAGTYIISGLKLPSSTILSGEGIDITNLKISDDAPSETIGITNEDMTGNATNIHINNFSIEGNRYRQGGSFTAAGGSLSSNVRYAGVKFGSIKNIKSTNAMLHGIDITYASDAYYYAGDGARVDEALESKYIHVDNCIATGFGDDGITTHHSRYLVLTNNYAASPVTIGQPNNNGIEIDDGSQHIMLSNNTTENSFGGLEIKAHATATAPNNVLINGHMAINCLRAYNFRHIGHHVATDPQTKSAHSIVMNGATAINPYDNGLYPGATPRALVISAYRNVQIDGFTAIGTGSFTSGQPAIAVQYRAENVMLNNINITGFTNASEDIKINGGGNKPKNVTLSNINIWNSSKNIGIGGGSKVYDIRIINANLQGTGSGTGIFMYNNTAEIVGVQATGYTNASDIAGKKYNKVPTSLKGGFSAGSTGSAAVAERSAVIASTGNTYAYNDRSWALGAGMNSEARGSRSGVMNSLESQTSGTNHTQLIMASRGVKTNQNYVVAMGYGADGSSVANTSLEIRPISGNINTKGQVQSGQNFGDYAEYYESQSGQSIPLGTIVTLDGRYIRKANGNDKPLGVISGTAGVILGDQMWHHKDKFLKDEFGVTLTEWQTKEWQDDEGNWYSEEVELPIPNPDFDPSRDEEYISRSERPEWNVVGLMGQVFTKVDATVSANDYVKPNNKGVGTKDNINGYYRVLEVTTPYNTEKGYGVAVLQIVPIR